MKSSVRFDSDLIRRYERFGPRYTSYPTAAQFRPNLSAEIYRAAASESNRAQPPAPLSIYVHIPFCASPCFYCGCSKIITRNAAKAEEYLVHLNREIVMQGELFDARRTVTQLHFGGGTPTFLSPQQLTALLDALGRSFTLSSAPDREYSIEIDPRTAGPGSIEALAAMGFNRVSLGVQDYDPTVQRAVNRVQPPEQTESVFERCRAAGFRSISADLIYGLPLQTTQSFAATLDRLVVSRPDRISVYAYAHLPRLFKAQRRIREADLPSAETRLELLGLTIGKLTDAGYEYVGMDHFALPDDELIKARTAGTLQRNFQGYSTHAACDLVGLGVTSIGRIGRTFAQNIKSLPEYQAALEAGRLPVQRGVVMTDDDCVRAAVIQELMCYGRITAASVERRFSIAFASYFAAELARLEPFEQDGLVKLRPGVIEVTPRGRLLLRNVAMVFDAYLQNAPAEPIYSRAI
jgi:oxygen-independent coproporphyrinogen-3 oxidase